ASSVDDLLEGVALHRYPIGAEAAPMVFQVAEQGDLMARQVLSWAGEALADLACGVIRQLAFEALEFDLVLVGSVFAGGPLLLESMCMAIHQVAPQARYIAPVEAVKKWSISCILWVPTMQGYVYFKASAALPLCANEPAVTRGLSAFFPGHVPEVLAADDERRWILMTDVGQRLDRQSPPEVYEEVICLFGSMQLQSAGRTAELVSMGCV